MAWPATVPTAIARASRPAITNGPGPSAIRESNVFSQSRITHHATGQATRLAITRITLRPEITFDGSPPSADQLARLHEEAHERCFIANSLKTEIVVEPVQATS